MTLAINHDGSRGERGHLEVCVPVSISWQARVNFRLSRTDLGRQMKEGQDSVRNEGQKG